MTRTLSIRAAGLGALFLAGCGGEPETRHDILDAAAIYADHRGALSTIRAAYPGPYADFNRIPARDPAAEEAADRDFLAHLRQDFPIVHIDFFPIADTGHDEINVVLWRENDGRKWRTVSLVYFSMPMELAAGGERMTSFDRCDDRAAAWVEQAAASGSASVFCRLDDHWQAYQKVE